MRAVCLVVLGLAAMAAAIPSVDLEKNLDTLNHKDKQIMILKLLNHITQPVMYKEIEEIGKDFKLEDHMDLFVKLDVVKTFLNIIKTGTLPRGEVFTLNIDRQMKEVVGAFHLLYYAKDFAAFFKTACWMRVHMNEGMFVYALTVACRHRTDCRGIVLPAPYEIYPFYFVRTDVIQKAYMLKMKKGLIDHKLCELYGIKKTDKDIYIIDENVYDKRMYLNDDDKLRYFTEDIDLNTYFYYFHVDYPFWMKDDMITNDKLRFRSGEINLYVYQQILARYYLERLSKGLGEIKTLSWNKPIKRGIWPWITLHNGVQLPVRMNDYRIIRDDRINILRLVDDMETIIREAILKGYCEINGVRLELNKPEDIDTLGKIIFTKIDKTNDIVKVDKLRVDAYRYLLVLMKAVLGLNTIKSDKYFVTPTLLDSYQTCLRDPVFYQLQKRIIDLVILFKRRLPSYTMEELYFPGVKIDNVVIDKLITYFDDYLMDITNAVTLTEEELKKTKSDMTILARKRRLNHKEFKVTMDIMSDKAIDCIVKIFLGPKKDHLNRLIDINRNRKNFVELDAFVYKLNTGKNTIVRNSKEMHNLVRDRIMTRDLWKKIDGTSDVRDLFIKDLKNYHTGFPTRLLLPRGKTGGLDCMIYIMVHPLKMVDNIDNIDRTMMMDSMMTSTEKLDDKDIRYNRKQWRSTILMDKMPLGFPLDRHIDVSNFFTPNMKFVDVKIFHKKMVCDMKTRWEKFVLKNYKLNSMTTTNLDGTFITDTEVNIYNTHYDDQLYQGHYA